jgi:hypothetical protein
MFNDWSFVSDRRDDQYDQENIFLSEFDKREDKEKKKMVVLELGVWF